MRVEGCTGLKELKESRVVWMKGERCGRGQNEIIMFGRRNLSFNLPKSATE